MQQASGFAQDSQKVLPPDKGDTVGRHATRGPVRRVAWVSHTIAPEASVAEAAAPTRRWDKRRCGDVNSAEAAAEQAFAARGERGSTCVKEETVR